MQFWWFYPQDWPVKEEDLVWVPFPALDVQRLEGKAQCVERQESMVPVQAHGLHILFAVNRETMTMEPLYWRGQRMPVRRACWIRVVEGGEGQPGAPLPPDWERAIGAAWQASLPWVLEGGRSESIQGPTDSPNEIEDERPSEEGKYDQAAVIERLVEVKGLGDWLLLVRRHAETTASLLPRSLVEAHLGEDGVGENLTMASSTSKPFWSGLLSPSRQHRPLRLYRGYGAYHQAMLASKHQGVILPSPHLQEEEEGEEAMGEDGRRPPDHLLFLVHGIGQKWAGRWGYSAIRDAEQLRQLVAAAGVAVIPILWRTELEASSTGLYDEDEDNDNGEAMDFDQMLAAITLETVPAIRTLASDVSLDVLLYMTPRHFTRIVERVRAELARCWRLFCEAHPGAQEHTRVSLIGHSLGSALVADLLTCGGETVAEIQTCMQQQEQRLGFRPYHFYSLGSPLALFLLLKHCKLAGCREFCEDGEALQALLSRHPADGPKLTFLASQQLYNVFLPHDPVAYRLEPLLIPPSKMSSYAKPVLLPYGKAGLTRFKMNVEESLGTLKSNLMASLPAWMTASHNSAKLESNSATPSNLPPKWTPLRRLNQRDRLDYVAQESILEHAYLSAISSHFTYCSDSDIASFILHELKPRNPC